MDKPVETFEHGGKKLKIYQDELAESPREWDANLGIMACFHRNYTLGDKEHGIDHDEFSGWEEMEDYIWTKLRAYAVLPIYLYDHSGLVISTSPFSCPWDSGQLGFIYTTRAKIRELGVKLPRAKYERTKRLEEMLREEVQIYNQYITGDTYGFELYEGEEMKDSCWGFFGHKWTENGLFEHAGWAVEGVVFDRKSRT